MCEKSQLIKILKKQAALVISTEKSQTLLGIIESFNDTRMVAFFMFGMKSNALRCVLCEATFFEGLTATGKGLSNAKTWQQKCGKK